MSSEASTWTDFTGATTPVSPHNSTGVRRHLLAYDVLLPPLGVLIAVINLSVVISSGLILKMRPTPRTTYLFLGNVAMADLITSVAYLFGQLYPKQNRAPVICYMQMGMIVSSTVASIWSVGLIGIDRFLYILYGMHYQRWITPFRARWLIIFTWLLGIVIGFLPAMGWRRHVGSGKACWFTGVVTPELIVLTTIVGFAPIIATSILYSIILYHALRKVKQLTRAGKNTGHTATTTSKQHNLRVSRGANATMTQDPNKKKSSPSKWKAIKVVIFTNGSFILTWVPFFIANLMYVSCEASSTRVENCKGLQVAIAVPLTMLGLFNSLLNPIIYAWWHNGFREFVRNTLCRRCRRHTHHPGTPVKATGSAATSSTKSTGASSTKSSHSREAMPVLQEQTQL
ncbi:5-hydroxytryptamine receptor 1A-like [Bacillus rossius redtenbacheri]|uniref:5-hydroxytryptamine receptor 1A-like n=1 Tax=Bacillus rossius redtenbacheri TaxID=93214 RepID=UPI002FDD8BC2